jgi:hypothetical protein
MAIRVDKACRLPAGSHTGIIVRAKETTKTFDKDKGAEEVVEIVIAPDYVAPDGALPPQTSVLFTPVLNGISALSEFLARLGVEPKEGTDWKPATLEGTKVAFRSEVRNGFAWVDKSSIQAVE